MPRRTLGLIVCGLLLATAALAVLVSQLGSRDSSTTGAGRGPGLSVPAHGDAHLTGRAAAPSYATDPPTSGPHRVASVTRDAVPLTNDQLLSALELGNVVLVYADPRLTGPLRGLATQQAGPFTAALEATGQAIVLDRRSTEAGAPIAAAAWGHLLRVSNPADPALGAFVQAWLGRGAPGAVTR